VPEVGSPKGGHKWVSPRGVHQRWSQGVSNNWVPTSGVIQGGTSFPPKGGYSRVVPQRGSPNGGHIRSVPQGRGPNGRLLTGVIQGGLLKGRPQKGCPPRGVLQGVSPKVSARGFPVGGSTVVPQRGSPKLGPQGQSRNSGSQGLYQKGGSTKGVPPRGVPKVPPGGPKGGPPTRVPQTKYLGGFPQRGSPKGVLQGRLRKGGPPCEFPQVGFHKRFPQGRDPRWG
jgi:hypothetical protein